jgi:hypothetical protein
MSRPTGPGPEHGARKEVTPVQSKLLISLAALAAIVVTFASAVQLTSGAIGPQPVLSANNGGNGGP